jgi:hypothetical protein
VIADLAVVLAVVIGLLELNAHRSERGERTEAIDAYIRALATQARLMLQRERASRSFGELLAVMATRGTMTGDSMASWLTTIAATAPQASRLLRGKASEAWA